MSNKVLYAKVIPPLKLRREIIYLIPESLINIVQKGSQVKVNISGKDYIAVVSEITENSSNYFGKFKEIISVAQLPTVSDNDLIFWKWISDYYMCSLGEVYKAAYPNLIKDLTTKKSRLNNPKQLKSNPLPELSDSQNIALSEIKKEFIKNNPVFLRGESGSGKSELYFRLANEYIQAGKSILLLLPELAISNQIIKRAQSYFPYNLLVYNSRQTLASKLKIIGILAQSDKPFFIIGIRSAILLPFRNLGLIIVDEEQESSYKQFEPAPRYNARDSSLVLAKIHGANAIFGSSTPSFESIENMREGKIAQVNIKHRFFEIPNPEIKIVETLPLRRSGKMNGVFSGYLVDAISNSLTSGDQVLIVSSKKYISSLDYQLSTKVIEQELKELFPNALIARFDTETYSKKSDEKRILNDFANHKYDILVSNKMTGKGFHFPDLNLAAILFAESLINHTDFRSGEKALQLVYQIAGRAGREKKRGTLIVQTLSIQNSTFKSIRQGDDSINILLEERKQFDYPPFVRLIYLTIKGNNSEIVDSSCKKLITQLPKDDSVIYEGPFDPGNSDQYFTQRVIIKIKKHKISSAIKKQISVLIDNLAKGNSGLKIVVDVDPI